MWFFVSGALAADLNAAWERDRDAIAARSSVPVSLDAADLAALAAGETVARRVLAPGGDGFAFGAIVVPASVEATWVAIQDAEHYPQANVRVEWLSTSSFDRRSYLHVDLPFVLADRQWVSEFAANGPLLAATSGRVWQRSWRPGDPATAPSPDPAAVWVDTSGEWTLIDVGDATLALFSVRTVLGGVIPEGLSTRWAVSTIDSALGDLAARAPEMPGHYDASHTAAYRPDGTRMTVVAPL